MEKKRNKTAREGAPGIFALRRRMGESQSEWEKQLNPPAMAFSRGKRGAQEPPANIYIQLGNITGDPECWYFWGRAGLHSGDLKCVSCPRRVRDCKKNACPICKLSTPVLTDCARRELTW